MEDLQKQVNDLQKIVDNIMVQLKEDSKYHRTYGKKDIYDNEQEFRSGVNIKRIATSDTDLPVGRLWSDSGTLKIKE